MAGETILDIDDSPTVQRLIEMILASQGYRVVLASDGEEGIAKAKAERPALILVDFVMPKMNGFQVCKALKEDPAFKDTPIILVTSKGDKVGSKFVDVLGISEYFTKPFQPEELLAKIREVLDKGMKKQVPAAAAAVASFNREPTPPRGIPQASGASAAIEQPVASSLEAMVRDVVERVVDELRRNILPDLIRRELGKVRPDAAGAGTRGEPGIRGDLSSFRLVEVMQMLGLQRQTGRLAVTGASGDLEIYFREGSVAFATTGCNGATADMLGGVLRKTCRIEDGSLRHALRIADMTGDPIDKVLVKERLLDARSFADCLRRHTESIVYRAMALKTGEFVFEKTPPPAFANAVQLKVDDLLLEGARRADEWVLIQQRIPGFDLVFESMTGNAEELTTRSLSDIDANVFSLVDGRRTVQDIIDELCLGEFEVVKSLFILLSVNLIRQKT
jgi:CheY-like chemotaxis protein